MPSIRRTGDPEIDSLNTDVAREIAVQHAHEEPTEHHDHDHDEHAHGVDWQDLVRILFVALAAAAVWFRVWEPLTHFSIIGIAATLIGGYPIFKEAVDIFEGRMTMELSMTIALVAALVVGEFFTALVIALFVLAAEVLEGLTLGRGRRAIEESRVPADGTVLDGQSFVDQASITGESMPVQDLKDMGLSILLLTGDSKAVAESVAQALGVSAVYPELLPEQKLQKVTELIDAGQKIAMLGDGINDAPALTKATVGVAMGSGTDVARESADIVLIGSDLRTFVETVRIARRCMKIIMQNFYGTIAVDSLGVGLAAFGMLNPLLAAFIHVSSELTFILNSTRMLPRKAQTTSALS